MQLRDARAETYHIGNVISNLEIHVICVIASQSPVRQAWQYGYPW
jgi:hypothetical protein